MKKCIVCLTVLLLAFAVAPQLKAADGVKIFFNAGAITDDSFSFSPFLWFLGTNVDIHLGEVLMLSPEANLITYKFKFDSFYLQPALLLNLKFDSFFIGGGLMKNILVSGETFSSDDFGLKFNAGVSGENVRFRVFVDTPLKHAFDNILIGFQVGLGF